MIDFPAFFGELNRDPDGEALRPHDWQTKLALRLAYGEPPAAIVVPTGGGKTATIDALVWALAAQAERPTGERTIGVRTVWAIDRRIVVDEVHAKATGIAQRLERALGDPEDALHDIAASLGLYTDGFGPPLSAARWRGQVRVEPRAHHPRQPEIITSTVAQVGSRLLFRGYGVGERSLALEAALAAVDCTICLDEAHLAEPFRQTVDRICAVRASSEPLDLGPLRLMTLSATPAANVEAGGVHTIARPDEATLAERLDAPKHLELVEPPSDGDPDQVTALLDAVQRHLDHDGSRRIVCVVNTVRLAVLVYRRASRLGRDVNPILLVGPQRPYDRQAAISQHRAAIFERQSPNTPLLVVATQTIEVGLDADFDALVTQSASATAVVQRLGRLNRAGRDVGHGTVVRYQGAALYQRDEPRCWAWLESRREADGAIDASPRALSIGDGPPRDMVLASASVLTDATIDLLQQTAPQPASMADPAIEPFLRGVDEPPSDDVYVCWRDDLRLDADDRDGCVYREMVLRLAPPRPHELVTIGIRRLHALLRVRFGDTRRKNTLAKEAGRESDIEGGAEAQAVEADDAGNGIRCLVVRDGKTNEVGVLDAEFAPRDIRPGDVVVLASSGGGYADGALAPESDRVVEDVGDRLAGSPGPLEPIAIRLATERGTSSAALRLAARYADQTGEHPGLVADEADARVLLGPDFDLDAVTTLDIRRTAGAATDGDPMLEDDDEPAPVDGALLEDERSGALDDAFVVVIDAGTRPDLIRSSASAPPSLERHARAVTERAARFAAHVVPSISAAVVMAARAHDHGKADGRFQAFFRGGTAGVGEEHLAKSTFGTDDRRSSRIARERAGLPSSLRHEIASVAVLAEHLERSRPSDGWLFDEDLALHLVGTHHGLGRPWPKMPHGGVPAGEFAVSCAEVAGRAQGDGVDGWADGGWFMRFVSVTGRYGAWGTAYLETLLVLADRTISAEGS